jgi:hypothetical protein
MLGNSGLFGGIYSCKNISIGALTNVFVLLRGQA